MAPRSSGTTQVLPPLTPRAQLRWDVVRPIVASLAPGRTIEVGVGQGAMGSRIAGLSSVSYLAVEPDLASFDVARPRIEAVGGKAYNVPLADVDPEPADLLCAFEVLEHIRDDTAALTEWANYVRPGGHLLLSVPADQHRFGPTDVAVGHIRRYDEQELRERLNEAGLQPVDLVRYGAPLGFALESVRDVVERRRLSRRDGDLPEPEVLSGASGRAMQFSGPTWKSRAVELAVTPFRHLQRVWPGGIGIVALARRPVEA